MKKFLTFLLFSFAMVFARAPENGESINVELKSGIKQRVKFAGFHQDTVLLGGYIKNQYTVVRLPKNSFTSIKDAEGNILDLDSIDSPANDSLVAQDTLQAADTVAINTNIDSTSTDSSADSSSVSDSTRQNTWQGKTIFIPFAHRPIDEQFAKNIQGALFSILEEERLVPFIPDDAEIESCREPSCIIREAREKNVAGAFFGNIVADSQDSIRIELTYFKESSLEPEEASFKTSNKAPFSSSIAGPALHNAVQQLFNRPIVKQEPDTVYKDPTISYIHVETDPEDAILSKVMGDAICKTPCTFATKDTGNVEIYAYWDVDEHLWAATAKLKVIPGDTTKTSLRLKRITPTVLITTNPKGSEIYPDLDTLSPFISRLGVTPKVLETRILGEASLKIKKDGYRDTTITFYVMPTEKNLVHIDMTPITIPAEIKAQQEWNSEYTKKKVGITLLGVSAVPFIFGGIFTYLAAKDYEDARKTRDELKKPHIGNGKHYSELKQKNKDYAEKGDTKLTIGISSFALGAALLATGIVFTF